MSILSAFISVGILIFILKYRVHIHVNIDSRPTRSQRAVVRIPAKVGAAAINARARAIRKGPDSPCDEIASALVNLGCKPAEARAAAKRAVDQGPGEFEEILRRAIQEARAA